VNRKWYITFILGTLFSINARATDDTVESKIEYGLASGITLWDAGQTYQIARQPNHWMENNNFLGRHPSEGKVIAYFLTMESGEFITHRWAPHPWDHVILGFEITQESLSVRRNIIHCQMRFRF
jgi:hypothetical protein